MKNLKKAILLHMSLFITSYALAISEEEQLKLDIEACWNQHEQIMGSLKNNFKKPEPNPKEASKKESDSDSEKSAEQVEKVDEVETKEAIVEKEPVIQVEQEQKEEKEIKVESKVTLSVEVPKEERVTRSRSLQRVELELKELTQ